MIPNFKISICGAFPGQIGGTTILVKQLHDGLKEIWGDKLIKIDYTSHGILNIISPFFVLFKTLFSFFCSKVSIINVSKRGFEILFFPIIIFQNLTGVFVIIRYFGGDADSIYSKYPRILNYFLLKINKSKVVILTETIKNIEFFESSGFEVYQITNCRPLQEPTKRKKPTGTKLRLLFMAQLKSSKGVFDVISAVESLENIIVDFYGPMNWDVKHSDLINKKQIFYKGIVPLGGAFDLMQGYDALVFPTTYDGESHAGVIIEAYSAGLPVIGYNWRSIPEIVIQNETGLLSTCNDIENLKSNIILLMNDLELLNRMSNNCYNYFKKYFTTEASVKRIEEIVFFVTGNSKIKPKKWQLIDVAE